jgi:hypothetical protein
MSAASDRQEACDSELMRREGALHRATARRVRLEALFADPDFLGKVLTDGRYLRLCAVIAWASEREEQARGAYDLRALAAGQQTGAAPRVAVA